MKLKAQIERDTDCNLMLFAAIDRARNAGSLDGAYNVLHSALLTSALYWLYRGARHIAVQHQHHSKRVAIITT